MRLLVAGEFRFVRRPDGTIRTNGVFDESFWARYLDVFDEVLVAARVLDADEPGHARRVDGPRVRVAPLQHYVGLWGYVRNRSRVRSDARTALSSADAVMLRAPGPISSTFRSLIPEHMPYGIEVIGDPAVVLGRLPQPAGMVLAGRAASDLRAAARGATVAAYVSRHVLPDLYPPGERTQVAYYSSATLPEVAYASRAAASPGPVRFVAVGSMERDYKGIDVLLEAFARLNRDDFPALTILGDGRLRPRYVDLARDLGVSDAVQFKGMLSDPDDVRAELDAAEVFVSASRTEGLPRAMIEAMARSVPCVGTSVGGTPELLPPWAMCEADDVTGLADLMRQCLEPKFRQELSDLGRAKSDDYGLDLLNSRRSDLYRTLRRETERWRERGAG